MVGKTYAFAQDNPRDARSQSPFVYDADAEVMGFSVSLDGQRFPPGLFKLKRRPSLGNGERPQRCVRWITRDVRRQFCARMFDRWVVKHCRSGSIFFEETGKLGPINHVFDPRLLHRVRTG